MSANSAGQAFDLRCEVREQLIDFLQREHPEALPRERAEVAHETADGGQALTPSSRKRAAQG